MKFSFFHRFWSISIECNWMPLRRHRVATPSPKSRFLSHTGEDEAAAARDLNRVYETASWDAFQRNEGLALVRSLPQSNGAVRGSRGGEIGPFPHMHGVDPARHATDAAIVAFADSNRRLRRRALSRRPIGVLVGESLGRRRCPGERAR